MAEWFLGTMGFSYKDWSGPFYPEDLQPREYLAYYSRIFNAAEIDSTFYGTPKLESVERWSSQTPDRYRFCLKAPRLITHEMGLVGAEALMADFVNTVRRLGEKLGVILLQFPGSFPSDKFPVFSGFLSTLPPGARYAVELRHPSWHEQADETAHLLEEQGVAWAATEYPGLPRVIHRTAGFLYIRWIGRHGSFPTHTEERIDRTSQLQDWWARLQAPLEQVEAVYGFFNNDYAGFAPATANRFKEVAGLPVEQYQPPGQLPLF